MSTQSLCKWNYFQKNKNCGSDTELECDIYCEYHYQLSQSKLYCQHMIRRGKRAGMKCCRTDPTGNGSCRIHRSKSRGKRGREKEDRDVQEIPNLIQEKNDSSFEIVDGFGMVDTHVPKTRYFISTSESGHFVIFPKYLCCTSDCKEKVYIHDLCIYHFEASRCRYRNGSSICEERALPRVKRCRHHLNHR